MNEFRKRLKFFRRLPRFLKHIKINTLSSSGRSLPQLTSLNRRHPPRSFLLIFLTIGPRSLFSINVDYNVVDGGVCRYVLVWCDGCFMILGSIRFCSFDTERVSYRTIKWVLARNNAGVCDPTSFRITCARLSNIHRTQNWFFFWSPSWWQLENLKLILKRLFFFLLFNPCLPFRKLRR